MSERGISPMKNAHAFRVFLSVVAIATWTSSAAGAVPDVVRSYFVPQVGPYTAPIEGSAATTYFHACPNNDGGSSLPLGARVKVSVKDAGGAPISGIAAADIYLLFNGGTAAQGFTGTGADSIIANSTYNTLPLCPDVLHVPADGPTDANGETFITFTGPGGVPDRLRKWGHYDSSIPVYVLGIQISGRITSDAVNGSYSLRIKNFDWTGGLGTVQNQGEAVTVSDFNGIQTGLLINNAISYWKDFDSRCGVSMAEFNMIYWHVDHNCQFPNNP
jgi:hypothetical protein